MTASGEVLALLSALSFAACNVMISRTSKSRGDKGVLFSVVVTIGFSFLLFLGLEASDFSPPRTRENFLGIAAFAFAGIAAMVFGRTLVFSSIRRLGPSRASAVKRLNPFFSVVLAAVILSEPVTRHDLAGLAAIALAFGILFRKSLMRTGSAPQAGPLAYGIGAAAALAYAIAYIARKVGLAEYDAPALGTFISAFAGLAAFAVLALLSKDYRPMFRNVFRHVDRPILLSALFVSAGQILMFAALAKSPVSTVVIISSLEIFFSIFLAWLVFREETRPDGPLAVSAVLAVVGVVLVASG